MLDLSRGADDGPQSVRDSTAEAKSPSDNPLDMPAESQVARDDIEIMLDLAQQWAAGGGEGGAPRLTRPLTSAD